MKELKLWKSILVSLNQNKKVELLTVSDSSNSSPGKQGFKMAVEETGVLSGTVGGGIMENNLVEDAKVILNSNSKIILKTLHHNPVQTKQSSGLICGGKQSIIFCLLDTTDIPLINKLINTIESQTKSILRITNNGIELLPNFDQSEKFIFNLVNDKEFEYLELYGVNDTIYIIGGGHVGLAVSKAMANLDFYIVIIDHRENIFTMDQNVFAHKKIIINYDSVGDIIKEGNNSYVVIVSPQHIGDEAALKSVINKNVKYIGMMGSKKKIKTVFDNLINAGIKKELLAKVHSPIGLEIGAQSPDEIAISIAAEIIKIKYCDNE
jgi:xanthine dehydrogenase accessory factor